MPSRIKVSEDSPYAQAARQKADEALLRSIERRERQYQDMDKKMAGAEKLDPAKAAMVNRLREVNRRLDSAYWAEKDEAKRRGLKK